MSMIAHLFTQGVVLQDMTYTDDAYGQHRRGAYAQTWSGLGWFDSNLKKSAESVAQRDEAESDGILYLPADAPITQTTRAIINGNTYSVFGNPAPIPIPGGIDHTETRIKRYVG